MLYLYVKTGCPYCARVYEVVDKYNIKTEELNIADSAVAEELVARGGKRQVPYLVDDKRDVEMYESEDIAQYLEKHYSATEE